MKKRTYQIISWLAIWEIPSHNKKRSQSEIRWAIDELKIKDQRVIFHSQYSNHSSSFKRTKKWIIENHKELLL